MYFQWLNTMYFCTSVRFLPIPQSIYHWNSMPLIYCYMSIVSSLLQRRYGSVRKYMVSDHDPLLYYGATSICSMHICNMHICNMYITHLDTYTYTFAVTHKMFRSYWSKSWPFTSNNFASIMSSRRFELLLRFNIWMTMRHSQAEESQGLTSSTRFGHSWNCFLRSTKTATYLVKTFQLMRVWLAWRVGSPFYNTFPRNGAWRRGY